MIKNNRILQYFLAVLALGIWGTIVYQVIQYYRSGDDLYTNISKPISPTVSDASAQQASYDLSLDYDDPFSAGTTKRKKKTRTAPKSVAKTSTPKADVSVQWPNIKYRAFAVGENNTPLALIQIDGQQYTLKPGDKVSDVKLTAITANTVQVEWNGQQKQISRN